MPPSPRRGLFIVFEGLDGAGTTTQSAELARRLISRGRTALETHEPSNGPLGRAVRTAIRGKLDLEPRALALAFAADRLDHVREIEAYTETGWDVICDRYVLSSLAYQSAQQVDIQWLASINRFAPPPDVTIFLDTSVDVCRARILSRGDHGDDLHQTDLLHRADSAYRLAISVAASSLGKMIIVNGEDTVDGVADAIWDALAPLRG